MALNARPWLTALVVGGLISAATSASASSWPVSTTGPHSKALSSVGPAAPAPTSSCTSTTTTTAKLTWTAITHAASYSVLQSTSSTGTFTVVATAVTGTTWTSGTLTSGATYYWKTTAKVSTNWVSSQSAATAGRTIAGSGCS